MIGRAVPGSNSPADIIVRVRARLYDATSGEMRFECHATGTGPQLAEFAQQLHRRCHLETSYWIELETGVEELIQYVAARSHQIGSVAHLAEFSDRLVDIIKRTVPDEPA